MSDRFSENDYRLGVAGTDSGGRKGFYSEVVLVSNIGTAIQTDGTNNTDGYTANGNQNKQVVMAEAQHFNGTSWDRTRGNVDTAALITHTAAATGSNGADQTNYNGRGVKVVVDITTITGTTPTLTVTIQGKDAASGKYYTILASAALNSTGTTVLEVYPGLTAAANSKADACLPRAWRVITAIGGTTPAVTATVGASVIV